MSIYYLVFLLSFILCILDYRSDDILKRSIYFVFCAIVVILPGLRGIGVDNDSSNYLDIFQLSGNYTFKEILTGNYWENVERGYMILNKIVFVLGGTIKTVFFLIAMLTGILNYSLFYKKNKFAFTSVLFYLAFFYLYRDFTQIRYGLSCALGFWAISYLLKKKYLLFSVVVTVSFFIHSTAILWIIVLPICFYVKNKMFYFILPFFCTVGLFFNPFPLLLSLGGVPEHMAIYLAEEGGGGFMVTVFGFVIMGLYILFQKYFIDLDEDNAFYFRLFALGVGLNLLFIQSAIFQRFTYLLFQFGVLLLPSLLLSLQNGKHRYSFVFLHFVFACFLLYYAFKLIAPGIIRPYSY